MILAIDPGKDKCGLAILDSDGQVITKQVILRQAVSQYLTHYTLGNEITTIVIGSGTFVKEVKSEVEQLKSGITIIEVEEDSSSLMARKLYWQEHPPQDFWRLIPTSLRVPPVPIDDYAAVILGRRFLKRR